MQYVTSIHATGEGVFSMVQHLQVFQRPDIIEEGQVGRKWLYVSPWPTAWQVLACT